MTVVTAAPARVPATRSENANPLWPLAAWSALVVIALVWGRAVVDATSDDLHVGAIPFFGAWEWHASIRSLAPMSTAVVAVMALPAVSRRWSWRAVIVAVACGAVLFGGALSFAKPIDSAWSSIHDDYAVHTHLVDEQGAGGFLSHYVDAQPTFPTHLQAHPPGMVLVLWTAEHVGLRGLAFENGLALGGAAAAAIAALVALRAVAGEPWARRAAPFVVLAPAAVWHTSADSFYSGVALVGVACVVAAITRADRRVAAVGGAIFGAALLLTYGVLLLAVVPFAVAIRQRRFDTLVVAAAACLAVLLVPALWGFSWMAGLVATKHQYDLNLARVRPYRYFVVGNLAVFAVAVGPAVAVALSRLRSRSTWLLVASGLTVVGLADASGLALAETERIWQPFMPLVLLAGAAVTGRDGQSDRRWLGLQVGVALILATVLRTPW